MTKHQGFSKNRNGDLIWREHAVGELGSYSSEVNISDHFRQIIREELTKIKWAKPNVGEMFND